MRSIKKLAHSRDSSRQPYNITRCVATKQINRYWHDVVNVHIFDRTIQIAWSPGFPNRRFGQVRVWIRDKIGYKSNESLAITTKAAAYLRGGGGLWYLQPQDVIRKGRHYG